MTVKKTGIRRNRRTRELILPFEAHAADQLAEARGEPRLLSKLRQQAWDTYAITPVPTLKDEAWRRTDIRRFPADKLSFESAVKSSSLVMDGGGENATARLDLSPDLTPRLQTSPALEEQGVIMLPLSEAAHREPELLKQYLGKICPPSEGKFAALAAGMAIDGMLVVIPEDVHLDIPIQAQVTVGGQGQAYATRLVVVVKPNASGTVVCERRSSDELDQLYTGTVELFVEDGASLTFVDVQALGDKTWNFTHERASVGRDASCEWITAAVGSRLTKTFLDLDLKGEGAQGRVSGFFFALDGQHLDLDTQQNHLAPRTTSDLLYKGALRDNGRSVWQGMIYVAPGAQNTDGYQANRNLLLNGQARADSIPGLEILADDVRCTHGATAGQLDEDQLFYLMSRGLPRQTAEKLVIQGFFAEVMQRIPIEDLRQRFVKLIDGKL